MDKESNKDSRNAPDSTGAEPKIVYKRRRVWGYWLVMILLLAACVMLSAALIDETDSADYYRRRAIQTADNAATEIAGLRDSIKAVDRDRQRIVQEYRAFRANVAENYPMVVNRVEFDNIDVDGNVLTPAGNALYANKILYLRPIIKYEGLTSGSKKFYARFYSPDGTLMKGGVSPEGYTYSSEYEVVEGPDHSIDFSGWGNTNGGVYRAGTYRVEIYCEGRWLKTASVVLH